METLIYSFTPDSTGVEFTFSYEAEHNPIEISDEDLSTVIPIGETPGSPGEYQGDGVDSSRTFSLKGDVAGANPSVVIEKLNEIMLAHPGGASGRFRQQVKSYPAGDTLSDTYIMCRVQTRKSGKRIGNNYREWEITYRAASPYYANTELEDPVTLVSAEVGGTTSVTPGGSAYTWPIFTIEVVPMLSDFGTITVAESVFGNSISIDADTAGTLVINCEERTVTYNGVDATSKIVSGGYFYIAPWQHDITTTYSAWITSSYAPVTSAQVEFRKRWIFV